MRASCRRARAKLCDLEKREMKEDAEGERAKLRRRRGREEVVGKGGASFSWFVRRGAATTFVGQHAARRPVVSLRPKAGRKSAGVCRAGGGGKALPGRRSRPAGRRASRKRRGVPKEQGASESSLSGRAWRLEDKAWRGGGRDGPRKTASSVAAGWSAATPRQPRRGPSSAAGDSEKVGVR